MATRNYIELKSSNNSINKKFRVLQGSLEPKSTKMQSVDWTLVGRIDLTEGPHLNVRPFTVKLKDMPTGTDPDGAAYAVLDDLKALFALKNAMATPTNKITLVDHKSVTVYGYLLGELTERNITPNLD